LEVGAGFCSDADGGDAYSSDAKEHPLITEFEVPSEMGNERLVMDRVVDAVAGSLSGETLARLKTAVAEAAMNAIEHGNKGRSEIPVSVQVLVADGGIRVRITDRGGGHEEADAETPDLEAKLAGLQDPRGWGLFLIKNMVDEMHISQDGDLHTIELVVRPEGTA
jgi:anti-sigma regulatory factor (Ser/Thr protein kinase)